MEIKRDLQGATFGIGCAVFSFFLVWWIYSRMQHSNWVILMVIPFAVFGIVAVSGFVDCMEKTNRDHRGKRTQ